MPEQDGSAKILTEQILERYVLGELSARETRRVEKILRHDETAAARLAALERSNAEILTAYPPELMAERILKRAAAQPAAAKSADKTGATRVTRPFRLPSFAMPLAAAALILIVILPLRTAFTSRDETRVKGLEARLEIYRQKEDGSERLEAAARVAEGDLLQITYVAGDAGYGAILSIDGRGTVSWHLPRPAGTSMTTAAAGASPLEPGDEIALPAAYQLDDAPDFERFFFVTSGEPFALEPLRLAAERLAAAGAARGEPLDLGRGLKQFSLLMIKENRP
jgi:hypothetical protein